MTIYFAMVDKTDSTFSATFARNDEFVRSFTVTQQEGDFCGLTVVIERPSAALLDASRKQWAWLSLGEGSTLTPLFFGRIVGVPSELQDDFVTVEFIAKPSNYEAAKLAVAAGLRVAPFWDYAFIDPQMWEDADAVLEGRTDAWHIDRVTNAVTVSSIIQGEDGTLSITPDLIPEDGLSLSPSDAPLRKVRLEMRAMWTQAYKGEMDITRDILAAFEAAGSEPGFVTSYTGSGLYNAWPEDGEGIGNVYEFGPQIIEVVDGGALKKKYKAVSVKYDTAPTSKDEKVADRPFKATFRRWGFAINSSVRYDVSIDRTEDISFDVFADVQSLVNDQDDEQSEIITLSSGNIGAEVGVGSAVEVPIGDVARAQFFATERGMAAIEFGLAHARALLLRRARAVEIKVRVPFETAILASCRKSATVSHPGLPGGSATGKIIAYSFGISGDSGLADGEIVIACMAGLDSSLVALAGTPTYAEADVFGPDVQEYTGRTILAPDISLTYAPPACPPLAPSSVGLTSVEVINGEAAQAALLNERFIDVSAAADALNAIKTQVRLRMTPLDTSPRETRYYDSDVFLAVPVGIDLGESA